MSTEVTDSPTVVAEQQPNENAGDSQLQSERRKPGPKKPLAHWFKPGQSGNPGGKPVGTRHALQGQFFRVLASDFEKHGKTAIESMRKRDPGGYVRVVASLMPKELELKRPLEEFGDDELVAAVEALRRALAAKAEPKALPNVVSEQ